MTEAKAKEIVAYLLTMIECPMEEDLKYSDKEIGQAAALFPGEFISLCRARAEFLKARYVNVQ